MMVESAALPYSIRTRNDADMDGVLELMRLSLGESDVLKRTNDMWDWKHEINPFGRSYVLLAETPEGQVIGLRTFLRWEFDRNGETMKGVRAVDTATHPDFRRMGLFKNLTLQAVDDVKEQGADFVFNTPNDQSRPGYLKMGWQTVGTIEPLIKVLNYPRFAVGLAKAKIFKMEPGEPQGSSFRQNNEPTPVGELIRHPGLAELVMADAAGWGNLLHTRRSPEYLDWRYAKHPTIDYRSAVIEEDGKLAGAAIFRANHRFGLREIVLGELLLARDDRKLASKLISEVKSHVHADYMIGYYPRGTARRDALQGNGFRRMPGQGMVLTSNPLSGPLGELEMLGRWGLSLGDVELF